MKNERRQFSRRVMVPQEVLSYTPGLGIFAEVKDISPGGMGIISSGRVAGGSRDRLVDIFTNASFGFIVPAIPCRVIYEIQQLSENASFSGSAYRIIGFEFHHLTRIQNTRLHTLIQSLSKADPDLATLR